jgi:hypothetical protein
MIRRMAPLGLSAWLGLGGASARAEQVEGREPAAAPAADTGGTLEIGLRLGYGVPLGKTSDADDAELSKVYGGKIPIWLDAGALLTRNIMVGLYGQYAPALMADDFCSDGDCSGNVIRFGLQGHYRLSPGESTNPWVGVGIGYEIASAKREVGGVSFSGSTSGIEFVNLQGGADFELSRGFDVGPFASLSIGQYFWASAEGDSQDIEQKALHLWLVLGVRGVYGF